MSKGSVQKKKKKNHLITNHSPLCCIKVCFITLYAAKHIIASPSFIKIVFLSADLINNHTPHKHCIK